MAMIHVNRGGTSLGTFEEEAVREGLRAGRFAGTDLGWREGMAAWQPLAQFTEFAPDLAAAAAAGVPPPTAAPPPVVPSALATTPAVAPGESISPRSGLPWENRAQRGMFGAFIETLQMVLGRPGDAFTVMKTEGGIVEPLIYALIGGCAGAIVSFLFSFGMGSMGFPGGRSGLNSLSWMGAGSIAFVVLIPILVVLGQFIASGVIHLCLLLVGGAKKPFETTFRVVAFTQGSVGPIQMIPLCGGVVAGIWGLVLYCIGLARAHEIETGRAVLAVLLPLIVCCGGGLLLAIAIPALTHLNPN